MTHLNEEQFIDILLGEPHSVAFDKHLGECQTCQSRMAVLGYGLQLAKAGEPNLPEMRYPTISYRSVKRKAIWTRMAWIAAAAMFVLSLLGFRMEFKEGAWAFQLSLFGSHQTAETQQITELEKRLLEAIDLNTTLTQNQLDARFNAIYQEREQEMGYFRDAVSREMQDLEILSSRQLIAMRNEFRGNIEKLKLEGKMQ